MHADLALHLLTDLLWTGLVIAAPVLALTMLVGIGVSRDMLKRTVALRRTRDADVPVTNPTHFAVGSRCQHGEMPAPRLIAKGAGSMAAAMRAMASRHRIPMVESRTVARALYRTTALVGSFH